ncbi:ABC transporter related protein [Desulfurispirillum indicum S5]|uniref:ABC transporter related protein n=3 Tax=Desulfurispirillum TaxID=393029 RepID=E6W212_DESIS|nr:ABC transporter ATP-binding protein [Desulfurispirillum indicum]ADU66638.1 ABC transporter related protein [Desulfurispirillum indicum S5]
MKSPLAHGMLSKPGIWGVMAPVMGGIRGAMALAALGSMATIGAVVVLALVVHELLQSDPQPARWMVLALLLTAVALILRGASFTLSHLVAFRLETMLRTELAEHLARVPLGFLLSSGSGALTKVIQDDVKDLHGFVADSTPLLGRSVTAPVVTLVVLLVIDWRLALVALGVLLAGVLVLRLAMRDHRELSERYDAERERINGAVIEFVQAMPVVRTFDDGSTSFRRYHQALSAFHGVLAHWVEASSTSGRLAMIVLSPLPTLIALLVAGSLLFASGSLSFAVWVGVLLIGTGMAEALIPLMWLSGFIRKANGSALRIQSLRSEPPLPEPLSAQQPVGSDIVFDSVSFAYGERSGDVLHEVSFCVPAGTVTALVGPSGSGKSTVARLLPRFWDVRAGAIRIGGVDVRHMSAQTLMSHVAFVFQDTFLFHDTIADNIRLGRPDATMAEVERAARAAQAHDFIVQLPEGYETRAGDRGGRLSGGQRQRITIARAILQDRPIVVLDEATAFADPENEVALVSALAHLMRGRTVILIAHRLPTVQDADQILVLEGGCVVERGCHGELLALKGLYRRLWNTYEQAQGWSLQKIRPTGGTHDTH